MKLKINLEFPFAFCPVIMDVSIFLILLKIMASHGILHQTSCAYTPQQNGTVERKNRYLIETTRTILIHGDVPQRFWGDVVLSACYLINRMPSSVLDNKIPHSILLPSPLFTSQSFGSTCFVYNFILGLDKLSPKSYKCVFLNIFLSYISES